MVKPIEPENLESKEDSKGSELTLKTDSALSSTASKAIDLVVESYPGLTDLVVELIDQPDFIVQVNGLQGSALSVANEIYHYVKDLAKQATKEQNSELLSQLVNKSTIQSAINAGVKEGNEETIKEVKQSLSRVDDMFREIRSGTKARVEKLLESSRSV